MTTPCNSSVPITKVRTFSFDLFDGAVYTMRATLALGDL